MTRPTPTAFLMICSSGVPSLAIDEQGSVHAFSRVRLPHRACCPTRPARQRPYRSIRRTLVARRARSAKPSQNSVARAACGWPSAALRGAACPPRPSSPGGTGGSKSTVRSASWSSPSVSGGPWAPFAGPRFNWPTRTRIGGRRYLGVIRKGPKREYFYLSSVRTGEIWPAVETSRGVQP